MIRSSLNGLILEGRGGRQGMRTPTPISRSRSVHRSRSSAATRHSSSTRSTMPAYVSGVNSRTISACRVFVAACEQRFILQENGKIITSEQFMDGLRSSRDKLGA